MCVYIDINSHIYSVYKHSYCVAYVILYIHSIILLYMCLLCDFFRRMPQLMPMVSKHHVMNHPICNHPGAILKKCHSQVSIPSMCVLVPAPEGANPPVQPNMDLNVPSNDHSPRPATLGIHPSIEPCRHPIFVKPLPSTQV